MKVFFAETFDDGTVGGSHACMYNLVKHMLGGGPTRPVKKAVSVDADIRRLEIEVSEKLGAKVSVDHSKKGSGKLVISYNSLDELDGILKHIR